MIEQKRIHIIEDGHGTKLVVRSLDDRSDPEVAMCIKMACADVRKRLGNVDLVDLAFCLHRNNFETLPYVVEVLWNQ